MKRITALLVAFAVMVAMTMPGFAQGKKAAAGKEAKMEQKDAKKGEGKMDKKAEAKDAKKDEKKADAKADKKEEKHEKKAPAKKP